MTINRTLMPIGISDFRELIEYSNSKGYGYLFADKTRFIEEIDDDGAKVILITRPRRFGKTLNLSMLHYFFAATVDGKPTKDLFNNLAISKNQTIIKAQQGKHPVIFLTFKNIKQNNFRSAIDRIKILISKLYEEHNYLLTSTFLSKDQKKLIQKFISTDVSTELLEDSLEYLSNFLYKHCKQLPIILIDEYDTPIQDAYLKGYYDTLIVFIRNLFGTGLKDNGHFKKAILTGITRVSKESLFSGVNNLELYTLLENEYSKHFGFTDNDTNDLFRKSKIHYEIDSIKQWYNGYKCGDTILYNPWSIIKCIKTNGKTDAYWINTSGNELVKKLILRSGNNIRDKFQQLMNNETIQEVVDKNVVFANLDRSASAVWSLLLMAGYLKVLSTTTTTLGIKKYNLAIPNQEVKHFYHNMITNWISGMNGLEWYEEFLGTLISGQIDKFISYLQKMLLEIVSVHDATEPNREAFYHGLVLGLIVGIGDQYEIRSNKESGLGFYDVALIPKDNNTDKLGIVIELKKADTEDALEKKSIEAFDQLDTKKYDTELKARGVKRIALIGIAFSAKSVKAKHKIIDAR